MATVFATESVYRDRCRVGQRILTEAGHRLVISEQDLSVDPEKLPEELRKDIRALIVGGSPWTAKEYDYFPNLEVLVRFGVGVDAIDMQAAKERGIKVCNTRGANARAVAEFALGMTISLLRRMYEGDEGLRRGEWIRMLNTDLCEKTVGLVGFGDIAKHFARMLGGFEGVKVLACRRSAKPSPEAEAIGVTMVSLEELLKKSDIVSLHMPSNPSTYHMVNDEFLMKMKEGSYLINTARGAVIDSDALIRAVHSGKLAGAAMDVYETEPVTDHPYFHEKRILCTPHIAADTRETAEKVGAVSARCVVDALAGKEPENWLNP